jgi:hypothetical protein
MRCNLDPAILSGALLCTHLEHAAHGQIRDGHGAEALRTLYIPVYRVSS